MINIQEIMKHCLNKIITFILVLTFIVTPLLVTAPAIQAVNFDTTLGDFQQDLGKNKYNKETFDFQSLIGVMSSMTTLLGGCVDTQCPTSIKTGAIQYMSIAIADIYSQPPASGVYYVQTIFNNLTASPAYAQTGTGFLALNPFLNAWRAVRNLTYILFVIAFVGLGLLIMFRQKISPQATLTIQVAMQRIIVGLILITFSYAIAGFLVDLIYVVFGFVAYGMQFGGLYSIAEAERYWSEYTQADFPNTFSFVIGRGIGGGTDIISSTPGLATTGVGAGLAAIVTAIVAATGVGTAVGGAIAITLIPFLLGLLLAIIFFLFRVLFSLARAYIMVIIYLVFAPLFILSSVITGRGIWDSWLRGFLSNLLVFPVVGLIIFFTDVVVNHILTGGNIWGPPYIGGQLHIVRGMISLGAVILLPNVPDIINQMFSFRGPNLQLPNTGDRVQRLFGDVSDAFRRITAVPPPV